MRTVASPDDPAAQDIVFRSIKEQTDTEETFEFLRSQIQECYETHCHQETCPPPKGDFAPRRVIRIDGTTDPPSLRLYAPEMGEDVRWCALSYCWDRQSQSVMTTVATLQERFDGIDFGELPKTLQDAIISTHRLGIQYIWIDSLCIVQDDNNEKVQDITQMGEVCSQAYITLSASSAANVTEGFLQNRSIPQPLTPIALRYANEAGVEGTIIATSEPISEGMPDPINSRAWTFREPFWCRGFWIYAHVFYPLTSELFFSERGTEEGEKERQTARYESFAYCKPDEDIAAGENPFVNVCCLHIRNFGGRGEGLLLVKDAEDDVYRRIGHFYWNLEDLGVSSEHAEKVEAKIV
ncbi:hypothetical protein CEP53_003891 [Fusarium sp. AF-6]|nr:hypothetical protein CEP53_003891 [Fusarium sp. AF-6]